VVGAAVTGALGFNNGRELEKSRNTVVEAIGSARGIACPRVNPTTRPLRICLVYDCLYPWTVGGAEHWYRQFAEGLAAAGHEVTYLTRRQWGRDDAPALLGINVIAVSKREPLYTEDGRRRIGEAVRFGAGVLRHLRRNPGRYDVVHTAAFPYFSLLAANAARRRDSFRLVVDWHEIWTLGYWQEYLGPALGHVGYRIQRACIRVPQHANCYAKLHVDRLRAEGLDGPIMLIEGMYTGDMEPKPVRDADPLVIFAGRHIPEKRVPALVPALVEARRRLPELQGLIFGDGPERDEVRRQIAAHQASEWLQAPGFVESAVLDSAMGRAMCIVLPSRREGYGMIVIEAAAYGTPSVVVDDPDSAATERIEEDVNGVIAASVDPADLAEAIVRIAEAGRPLRDRTSQWFADHAASLSLEGSMQKLLDDYAESVRS
jgi:glycosyltransferase involved in cell wall biosynthesis